VKPKLGKKKTNPIPKKQTLPLYWIRTRKHYQNGVRKKGLKPESKTPFQKTDKQKGLGGGT